MWRGTLFAYSNVFVGVYTALHDKTQMSFLLAQTGVIDSNTDAHDQARFARLVLSQLERIRESFGDNRFATFVVQDTTHCVAALDIARTHAGFDDWLGIVLNSSASTHGERAVDCGRQRLNTRYRLRILREGFEIGL